MKIYKVEWDGTVYYVDTGPRLIACLKTIFNGEPDAWVNVVTTLKSKAELSRLSKLHFCQFSR